MNDVVETTVGKSKRFGKRVLSVFTKSAVAIGAAVVAGIVIGDQISKHRN